MSKNLTEVEKIIKLPWLIVASLTNQVFWLLAIGGSIVVLFFNELGLDKSQIGVLISLIPFSQVIGIFAGTFTTRFGYKKGFLIFLSLRKFIAIFILFTPLVAMKFGLNAAYIWVVSIFIIFSIFRAIAESAWLPWAKDIIPDNIRGKFNALNSVIATAASIVTFFIAGYVIDTFEGIGKFLVMISVGIVLGGISVVCYSFLPGGTVDPDVKKEHASFKAMLKCFSDKNYARFLTGIALASLAFGSILPFIPLYLKEVIGIAPGMVVWIDIAGMIGTSIFVFFWGWAGDRYGSKPIMLITLTLSALLPISWFLLPRGNGSSVYFAAAISFVAGAAFIGWVVSFMSMYLYRAAVPDEKRSSYIPVFYSLTGLVGGTAPLVAGWVLDNTKNLSYQWSFINVDSFTPIFAVAVILILIAIKVMSKLKPDGDVSAPQLMGMVIVGNPVSTLGSLVRYHRGGDETTRIAATESMGLLKTNLSSNELIEALEDPSFNVRHQAINAISRLKPASELVDALVVILAGDQPDLSLSAAWALGRLGDKSAIIPLREMLLSDYHLLQARSARALGMLGDRHSNAFMSKKLRNEPDKGLCVAYASALSMLNAKEAVDDILNLLDELEDQGGRDETALAVARLLGNETGYIRTHRKIKKDLATAVGQNLMALKRIMPLRYKTFDTDNITQACIENFARGNIEIAVDQLLDIVRQLPLDDDKKLSCAVVKTLLSKMTSGQDFRPEQLELLIHSLRILFIAEKKKTPQNNS